MPWPDDTSMYMTAHRDLASRHDVRTCHDSLTCDALPARGNMVMSHEIGTWGQALGSCHATMALHGMMTLHGLPLSSDDHMLTCHATMMHRALTLCYRRMMCNILMTHRAQESCRRRTSYHDMLTCHVLGLCREMPWHHAMAPCRVKSCHFVS